MTYEAPNLTLLGTVNPTGQSDGVDTKVVDVQSVDGWRLVVVQRGPHGCGYDVTLTAPSGKEPYTSHWRRSVADAYGRACDYLANHLQHPKAAAALREMAAGPQRLRS